MTAMTTAVAIEKFLSNPDRLMVDPELCKIWKRNCCEMIGKSNGPAIPARGADRDRY
jgi:hypothetical protein